MARRRAKASKSSKSRKSRSAAKATTARKTRASYGDAVKALKGVNARYKEIGCGPISLLQFMKVIRDLGEEGVPLRKVCFVALNAPFMRRPPVSPG